MRRICVCVSVLMWLLAGCSKSGEDSGASGAAAAPDDPAALGEKIAADHAAMMEQVAELLDAGLEPAELKKKADALREKTIAIHVASGKQRQALDAAGKQKCDAALRSALFRLDRGPLKKLQTACKEIRKEDNELANELAEFNTLTQYAAFELLKKQKPKEAERLGI